MDGATEYWHDQRLLSAQARWRGVYGLSKTLALEASVPFRLVRDRIEFETAAGAPYAPADPDRHHRNETVSGLADPTLSLQYGRLAGPWVLALSAGITLPAGTTVDNPFALDRAGLRHQHTQLGAGVASPSFSASASRPFGAWRTHLQGTALLPIEENSRGYRPGSRLGLSFSAGRQLVTGWSATLGADFSRENAERWDGNVEEEGNLGRSDLFLRAAVATKVGATWAVGLTAQVPVWSDVEGAQIDLPLVLGLTISR